MRVSPVARKSKALAELEAKFQVMLLVSPVFAAIAVLVTVSRPLRVAFVSGLVPLKVPVTATESTVAKTVLARSGSTTVSVPLVLRTALVSVIPALDESPLPTVMTGVSLVAATVTVKVATAEVAEPSLTDMSKIRVPVVVGLSLLLL